jgi:hypothetical protein
MECGGKSSKVEKAVENLLLSIRLKINELAREPDETSRFLKLSALINTFLESQGLGRIVITGGFAVEVYTGRTYRTMDVDVIAEGLSEEILRRTLENIGRRIGRGYLIDYGDLMLKSIDIVATTYTRRKKPVKLVVDGDYVYLDPPEDLIVVYLAGWKFWNATEDRDKALALLKIFQNKLDEKYLDERAKDEDVIDKLGELTELIKTYLISF